MISKGELLVLASCVLALISLSSGQFKIDFGKWKWGKDSKATTVAPSTGPSGPIDITNPGNTDKEKQQVYYLLRNRAGQSWKEIRRNGEVPPALWNPDGKLKLIIHGYSPLVGKDAMRIIRAQNIAGIGLAYSQQHPSVNVILVDWTAFATRVPSEYHKAVDSVSKIGRVIGDFLTSLYNKGNLKSMKQVHIIGFSLGAHVAGNVGSFVQRHMKGERIARITGLDPMGPEFDEIGGKRYSNELRALSKHDAEFVDVIHCNMGLPASWADAQKIGRYGTAVQAAHADFYPNGGERQRGCKPEEELIDNQCSHKQCNTIFAMTITRMLLTCPCDDYEYFSNGRCDNNCDVGFGGVYLGEPTNTTARGRYFLDVTV